MTAAAEEAAKSLFQQYLDRGFPLIPFPEKRKGPDPNDPAAKGWPKRAVTTPEGYVEGSNWGVLLGGEIAPGRFLLDVDFDWVVGLPLAKQLLPPTGFGFGRASKIVSHSFYTTSKPVVSKTFVDLNNKPFVELRGTKVDGTLGLQTMCPPSLHPDGERLELRMNGEIGHNDNVPRRVALYAVACILFKYLGHRGLNNEARLAVAGFLLKQGVSERECVDVCEAIAKQTENTVGDVAPVVSATAEKIRNRQRVSGARALAKLIGDGGTDVVARIREWLADGAALGDGDVRVEGGKLSEIVDQTESALLGKVSIYNRGGALVRPVRLDTAVDETVRRAEGSTVLMAVKEPWLLEQMGQVLRWHRGNAQCDPPSIYARTLLGRGEWRFPVLRSLVTAPTLARNGRIVETPGFDAETGLLIDIPTGVFPPVPVTPSKDDALAALATLVHPLRGFPFANEAAKSTAVAALLTALVRPSLRTTPLIGFDAPTAGTGKSLLAEMAGLLATGVRPPALAQGKTAEEDENRLATVLFAGDPIIHIDNCERQVAGDFLCSRATQEIVQARILGLSERRILPSTALVLLSGNNLTFAGDTSRRAVVCRLDANVERPDTREFDFDCHVEVLANRAELVVAGLTVLRAYSVAGRPERLQPMGSFNDWEWIRGALVWLGMADPAETRQAILDNDPRRDELSDVLQLWQEAFGAQAVEVGDVAKRVESGDDDVRALHTKLVEVACRGSWSGKNVGWWLRRNRERVVGGRCFRCLQEGGRNGQRWYVVVAGEGRQAEVPF